MVRAKAVNGWECDHITDRVIRLRKSSYEYRAITGRDGYVMVRAEPGHPRDALVDQAYDLAEANDAALGLKVAGAIVGDYWKAREKAARLFAGAVVVQPGSHEIVSLQEFQARQSAMARAFSTPQDPSVRVYRP